MHVSLRVRRIVQSDPDAGKVSRDALVGITKATELFVQFLAVKGYENTLYNNKRQVKATDITRAIHSNGVLDWLREDFPIVTAATTSKAESQRTQHDQHTEPEKPTVTDFFVQRDKAVTCDNEDNASEEDVNMNGGSNDDDVPRVEE